MTFKTASLLFWTLVVGLVGARVVLHEQIALGASAGQLVAWLRTLVG